jgi:hypothetical protein
MSEMAESPQPSVPEIQARLRQVSRMLRESSSMEPSSQRALAELVDELNKALATAQLPAAEVAELAVSTAHIAEALHHEHDRSLLGKARDRLQEAILSAEAKAPNAVALAGRVLNALAEWGI